MRRREFIPGLCGAVAWPLGAPAQQSDRMRRIAVLLGLAADDPDGKAQAAAFLRGLVQLGWIDRRNVQIDYRWGSGNADNIRKHAVELAALAPDVIVALGGAALVQALLQATRIVPIVFTYVVDPVGAGFVDSLARPGGNATGLISSEYILSGKWLQLLKQIAPSVTRVAVLRTSDIPTGPAEFGVIQATAQSLRVEVNPVLGTSSAPSPPSRAPRMAVSS